MVNRLRCSSTNGLFSQVAACVNTPIWNFNIEKALFAHVVGDLCVSMFLNRYPTWFFAVLSGLHSSPNKNLQERDLTHAILQQFYREPCKFQPYCKITQKSGIRNWTWITVMGTWISIKRSNYVQITFKLRSNYVQLRSSCAKIT